MNSFTQQQQLEWRRAKALELALNSILKEAWTISQTENVKGDKLKALALAKECYAMKLELLTNATVVDDAIRFVAAHTAAPIDKANSDKLVFGEKNYICEKQQPIATTNSIF